METERAGCKGSPHVLMRCSAVNDDEAVGSITAVLKKRFCARESRFLQAILALAIHGSTNFGHESENGGEGLLSGSGFVDGYLASDKSRFPLIGPHSIGCNGPAMNYSFIYFKIN